MGISGIVVRYVVIGCALLLSACGGGGGGGDSGSGSANTPAPPPPTSGIGPAGGTVNGPNGTKVVIPAGRAGGQHSNRDRADRCQRDAAACRNSVVRYDIRLHAARHDVRGARHGDAAARSCCDSCGRGAADAQDQRAEPVAGNPERGVRHDDDERRSHELLRFRRRSAAEHAGARLEILQAPGRQLILFDPARSARSRRHPAWRPRCRRGRSRTSSTSGRGCSTSPSSI